MKKKIFVALAMVATALFLGNRVNAQGLSFLEDTLRLRASANEDIPAKKTAFAQTRFEIDEDEWFRTDRDYTFGFRITRRYNDALCYDSADREEGFQFLPRVDFSKFQHGARCVGPGKFDRHFEWYLGQQMYTPSEIRIPARVLLQRFPNERPYAGWLYLGFAREIIAHNDSYWRYGVEIGCTGPCSQAQRAQEWFHDLMKVRLPAGWDSQIRSGLGVNLHYQVVPVVLRSSDSSADFTLGIKGNLGNIFTDAAVTSTVRLGLLSPRYGKYRASETKADNATLSFRKPKELYLFLRADGKYVGYNALLQGHAFGDNSPRTVSPRRFVYEGEFGVVGEFNGWSLSMSVFTRPNEMKTQFKPFRHHEFGRVSLTIPF